MDSDLRFGRFGDLHRSLRVGHGCLLSTKGRTAILVPPARLRAAALRSPEDRRAFESP